YGERSHAAPGRELMMDRLSIEPLCVRGMPPVQWVELAADLGLTQVTLGSKSPTSNPFGYGEWSLRNDASLRRGTLDALRTRQVAVSLVDGFFIYPGTDVDAFERDVEVAVELGATRINTVSSEPDRDTAVRKIRRIVDMASAVGIVTVMEFAPIVS